MLRIPSQIQTQPFESLKFRENTFVAFRSNLYPFSNQVFFEENTLIYILEGDKIFRSQKSEYYVQKGDLLFVRKGFNLLSESTNKSYKSLIFFVGSTIIKDFINQNQDILQSGQATHSPSWVLRMESDETFSKYTESILAYFKTETPYLHQFLMLKAQELLLHLLNIDKAGSFKRFLLENYTEKKIDLGFILNTYYKQNLTLAELAKLSGRSLSAFKRDFKEMYPEPPAIWIRNRRLEQAHFLLENKWGNIGEVATEVGYASVSLFIKNYKEKYGTTPKKSQ